MPLPVDQPSFWSSRIKRALEKGNINLAIWDASDTDWNECKRIHSDILKEEIQFKQHDIPSILDVGCGLGTLTEILPSGCEARYTGIDISPELINWAYKLCSLRSFYCRDIREVRNVQYDYVISRSFGKMIIDNLGYDEWLQILHIMRSISRKAVIIMDYENPYDYTVIQSDNPNPNRKLPRVKIEIGPGEKLCVDWITVGLDEGVDKRCRWGEDKLPFENNSVDLVYASHVLEHIPWFATSNALTEAYRVLSDKGKIEIWVPDFAYLVSCYNNHQCGDNWRKFNTNNDPMVWLNGRMFTYGGKQGLADPNWHRALFDENYLSQCLESVGFKAIEKLKKPRGHDHGPINLGMCGYKI